jgi:hypothetical protein
MAQQTINVGAAPNDGTGTPLRTAFQYTNSNFSELYTAVGPSGNNIVVPGNATITGDLTVDTSTLKVDATNNRVGFGTSTPSADAEFYKSTNGQNRVLINNPSTGTSAYSSIDLTTGTTGGKILQLGSGYSGAYPYITGSTVLQNDSIGGITLHSVGPYPIYFGTNNTLRATLDSSGNVGVGVTPSAWATYKGLQVGYASLAGYAGADTLLGSNVYFDGGAFRYIAAGLASSYRQLAGGHQWSTAVAGVNPGDILTPLPLATLDASGNFSPTGNVVMANTKGIDFSATASGSGTMTSELLNDYEEGTWVGTLKGATTDPTIAVTATGRYTKVGRLVSVQISFSNVNTTGASGDAYIIGLPFANSSITVHGSAASFLALTFSGYLGSEADPGGTNISLFDIRSGNVWASAQHSAGTSRYINAELTYTVA